MDNIRPYLILGQSQRDFVTEKVRECVHAWADEWLARGSVLPALNQALNVSADRWVEAQSTPLNAISIGWTKNWVDQAKMNLAGHAADVDGSSSSSVLQLAIVDASMEDLARCLCGSTNVVSRPDDGPAEQVAAAGSGFLAFSCQMEGKECFQIVAWPDWVASFRSKPSQRRQQPQLVPAVEALGSESVLVRAIIGEAELSIGDFATLAIGDVVIIDRRIKEPIPVSVDSGDVFAGGHLCTSSGRRAIELVAIEE